MPSKFDVRRLFITEELKPELMSYGFSNTAYGVSQVYGGEDL